MVGLVYSSVYQSIFIELNCTTNSAAGGALASMGQIGIKASIRMAIGLLHDEKQFFTHDLWRQINWGYVHTRNLAKSKLCTVSHRVIFKNTYRNFPQKEDRATELVTVSTLPVTLAYSVHKTSPFVTGD